MEKELKRELKKLEKLELKTEKFLADAPEEKLRCAINKGSYQYYIGKEYQGKKKRKLVQKIAQKEYNQRLLVCIKRQKSALKNFLNILEECGLEEVYTKLHPARRQLVKPYIKPMEDRIADTLNRKGIPYHYELPLELKYRNRSIVMYPDFTVFNKRTGKRYILEHLGMMDKLSYHEKAMWKIDVYEKNGILLGDGLIITHETSGSPLDTNVLDGYVEWLV